LGLVQLPDYYVNEALASGELVEVLQPFRATREGIWALFDHQRNLLPKVRLLVDFVAQNLAANN
jgi:DNA-binding transcriptional LysR family regulator